MIDKFIEFFFNDENISVITQQLNEKYNDNCLADVQYNEIKTNLKILEKSRDNLVEAIAQTGVNDTISAKIKEYEEQKRFTRHIAFELPDDHSARAFRMRRQYCG